MTDPLKKAHYNDKTGSYLTPQGRMTFVALAKKLKRKDSKRADDEGAYTVALLLKPDVDLSVLVKAVNDIVKDRKGFKKPFVKAEDVDVKGMEGVDLTGYVIIRASTYRARPTVMLRDKSTVDVENLVEQAYPGRHARISIVPHEYAAQEGGKPGVNFYLNNVQLLDHDEPLKIGAGGAAADDEFDALDAPAAGADAAKMFE